MSAGYENLRYANHQDTIDALISLSSQSLTRAAGNTVYGAGEGIAFEDSEGDFRSLDVDYVDELQTQINDASEDVRLAEERLDAAEAELVAAQERIDAAGTELTAMDARAVEQKAYLEEVKTRLDDQEKTLTQANERLDARIAEAAEFLAEMDSALAQNKTDIDSLQTSVSSFEDSIQESNDKIQEVSSRADEANAQALSAREAAEAAEARVQAIAKAQGSLIINGGFETSIEATAPFRYETSSARNGNYVARFDLTKGSQRISWPEARDSSGQSFEMRFWAKSEGSIGTSKPVGEVVARAENGAETVVSPSSDSIAPALTSGWQEFILRFKSIPSGVRSIVPRTGVLTEGSPSGAIWIDDVVLYDTASYQEALDKAIEAKKSAEAAATEAAKAMTRANQAYTSSSGKATISNTTTDPQGVGLSAGDIWRKWTSFPGGVVVGEWTWTGSQWTAQQLSHQMLSSLDLGKATVGELNGSYISAGSINADRVRIGTGGNLVPWSNVLNGTKDLSPHVATGSGSNARRGSTPTCWGNHVLVDRMGTDNGTWASVFCIGGGYNSARGYRDFRVVEDEELLVSFYHAAGDAYSYGNPNARLVVEFRSEDGTIVGKNTSVASETAWKPVYLSLSVKVPKNANSALLFVQTDRPGPLRVVNPSIRAKSTGSLIVDGAIEGRHVKAESVAAEVGKFINLSTDKLIAGEASMGTATANKLFADIFASNKITSRELYVGSPSNLIPGGWGGKSRGWSDFTVNSDDSWNTGQPAESSFSFTGESTKTAKDSFSVIPGKEYRFSVWVKSSSLGSKFSIQFLTNNASYSPYMAVNQEAPESNWKEFVSSWTPAAGVTEVTGIVVSANQSAGTGTQTFGAFTLAERVDGVLIKDGTVTAPKIKVTDTLSAQIVDAMSVEAKKLVVTGDTILNRLDVLGPAIVDDLNVRGTLKGRNAIFKGTIDVEQLNVTTKMVAEMVAAMSIDAKRLIVTEDAIMNRVTVIDRIVAPKIDALETRTESLLATKASIADLSAGNLTISGHFRSGGVGQPGVVIPDNYTTKLGMEQLGVWLTSDGKAPSLGSEYGATAGMWLDNASNSKTSKNSSPLHIRGQRGAGVIAWGGLRVGAQDSSTNARIDSAGTGLQIQGAPGKLSRLYANEGGTAQILVDGTGPISLFNRGTGDIDLISKANIDLSATSNVRLNGSYSTQIRGDEALVFTTDGNIALRGTAGKPYNTTTPSSGSWVSLFMDVNNGRVYRSTSARRYKAKIEEFIPDPSWLDMPVVTYVDAKDPEGGRPQIGTIAEDALTHGAEALVMWSNEGPEDYRYEREVPVLRYFVRENRNEIADLKARVAELEAKLV